jgi:diguanylate cyclase
MHYEIDKDRAEAFARDAMAWLTQRNIPPIPENFELSYAYVGLQNTDLRRTVDDLIGNGCKFDASVMGILHQRYFRGRRNDDIMVELGKKISTEINGALQVMETAGRDQSAYGRALSKASGELDQANSSSGPVKALIDQIISETRAMEGRSKTLELQLQTASQEVSDLRERLESVRRESLTDQLTGLSNRKAFDSELKASVERSIETGEPLTLLMADIDHFKSFNDSWGHQTGDQVLRLVANCLSENVKGKDTAARYGGEEFGVILPQTALEDAVGLANQIRGKVESKKLVKKSTGDILGVITVSIGVTQYDLNESVEEFIRRADICLYAAKRSGRNRVVSEADTAILSSTNVEAA